MVRRRRARQSTTRSSPRPRRGLGHLGPATARARRASVEPAGPASNARGRRESTHARQRRTAPPRSSASTVAASSVGVRPAQSGAPAACTSASRATLRSEGADRCCRPGVRERPRVATVASAVIATSVGEPPRHERSDASSNTAVRSHEIVGDEPPVRAQRRRFSASACCTSGREPPACTRASPCCSACRSAALAPTPSDRAQTGRADRLRPGAAGLTRARAAARTRYTPAS